ncbi:MAG: PqqD family protein [Candidatus Riflebacteria bacterium]|nr:PqqD family protein [Candidatus Riflebacteria bacterium]
MNLNSRVFRSKEPISAPVNNELVMLNAETGKYYGLNGVATKIWEAIEEEISIRDLCKIFQDDYDVESKQCETEILEFLNCLKEKNLIKVIE